MAQVKLMLEMKETVHPAGTIAGMFRFTWSRLDTDGINGTEDTNNNEITIDVPPGKYAASAYRMDDAGNVIGRQVFAQFAVKSDPSEIPVIIMTAAALTAQQIDAP